MEATEKPKSIYLAERKCWRKRGHWKTLKAARRRARAIFKETGLQLYPYICGGPNGCGEVHLTKQPSAKGKVI